MTVLDGKKKRNKTQTPTERQTNTEQILTTVRSVQGPSPFFRGLSVLVYY